MSVRRGREGVSASGSGGMRRGSFEALRGLTNGPDADVRPLGGGHSLRVVSHDGRRDAALNRPSGRLMEHLQAITTPNPWRFSKNFLNKHCRAR